VVEKEKRWLALYLLCLGEWAFAVGAAFAALAAVLSALLPRTGPQTAAVEEAAART
jgi:hypothetical protein